LYLFAFYYVAIASDLDKFNFCWLVFTPTTTHDILWVHVLAFLDLRERLKGLRIKGSWLELQQYVLTKFVFSACA